MAHRILFYGLACALLPSVAAAQANNFRALDRNQDGAVSNQEWYAQPAAPVPFSILDLDNDGRISQAEFQEWSAARGGAGVAGITAADRFRMADRNRDKAISQDEWKDGFPFVGFEAVDANRDQRITYQEFNAWDARRGGAGGAIASAQSPGAAPDLLSDRLRTLDAARGAAGVSGSAGLPGPAGAVPSNNAPASVGPATAVVPRVTPGTSAVTAPLSTSPGAAPGASSPAVGTGSGLTTR